MISLRLIAGAAAALAAGCIAADANASGPSTVYVGFSPGGTNDDYGRLVARHIGDHLPGHPTVIVKNMPGAGSRKLAMYLSAKAPRTGQEIGLLSRDLLVAPLLHPERNKRFDPRRLTWVGSPTRELMTCVTWKTSPVQDLADLKARPFIIPSDGAYSGAVVAANVLNTLVGAHVRVIEGYPGGSEMNLAMERGEVNGRCALGWGAIRANYYDWIKDAKMKVLIQLAIGGSPDLPGVPVLDDLVTDREDHDVLALLFANQAMGRPFAAPPGMPESMTSGLRAAFRKTVADPAFAAEAKRMKLDVLPVSGDEIEALVSRLYAAPPAVLDRARALARPDDSDKQGG